MTTTIAGGYAQKTGKVDGPAQNASFSKDFELVFVPEKCAVLVSDRGSQLVRQIDLKVEDCRRSPQSGKLLDVIVRCFFLEKLFCLQNLDDCMCRDA